MPLSELIDGSYVDRKTKYSRVRFGDQKRCTSSTRAKIWVNQVGIDKLGDQLGEGIQLVL